MQILWQNLQTGSAVSQEILGRFELTMHDMEELQTELLRRIADRDRGALSEFYDQTARPLFSIACRILGNVADAEEAIQDVFVQIWIKAEMFDAAKGQPFHWALALTRNRCIDSLRARQRRSRIMVETDSEESIERAAESMPVETELDGSDATAIHDAVHNLPKEQRQAIEMAFFRGLTHQEIAESLNEPLGTIKARIRRGMLKLREDLQSYI